jgi:hypothetical protein
MIDVMNKLKANFAKAARKLVHRWVHPAREATSSPPDVATEPRHPLFGALKGYVRVMPGTDLTDPADPDWGRQ